MKVTLKFDLSNKDDKKKLSIINEFLENGKASKENDEHFNMRPEPIKQRKDIPVMPDDLKMPQTEMGKNFGNPSYMTDYEEYKKFVENKINNPPRKKGFFSKMYEQ